MNPRLEGGRPNAVLWRAGDEPIAIAWHRTTGGHAEPNTWFVPTADIYFDDNGVAELKPGVNCRIDEG